MHQFVKTKVEKKRDYYMVIFCIIYRPNLVQKHIKKGFTKMPYCNNDFDLLRMMGQLFSTNICHWDKHKVYGKGIISTEEMRPHLDTKKYFQKPHTSV